MLGDTQIQQSGVATLGEAGAERGGALEARAHRVLVVLDDVDNGQVEKRRHVERLVKDALVAEALKVKEAPTSPDEGPVIESASGNGLMVILAVLKAFAPLKSVTVALTTYVPLTL